MESTSTDTDTDTDTLFLPEPIIYSILSRLPAKSLLRFRSVCKLWLSIISKPCFIKTHHSMSTKDPQLILVHAPEDERPYLELSTCSLHNLQNNLRTETMFDEPVTEGEINRPVTVTIEGEGDFSKVVGYCNGLFCLASDDELHLVFWNPSTRKSRRLPKIDKVPDGFLRWYGFCYDESTDDFKVFAIYDGAPVDDVSAVYKMSVYSSKSGSWRVINTGDLSFATVFGNGGVFANRAIYWNVGYAADVDDDIISFDIKTETYRQVLQPKYDREEIPYFTLGHFGNSLYVLYDFKTYADIWVIKEFDPEESWTKLVTIEYDGLIVPNHRYLRPICTFENGVILLNLHHHAVFYNTKDGTWENPLDWCYERLHVYSYNESLVSP